MSISEFFHDVKKGAKKNTELNQLYKKPVSENWNHEPHTQVFKKDVHYQADTLYLPEDKGYKFALVCVDLYDGTIDAEPMKEVNPSEVLRGFNEIFKRKHLKFPTFMTFDRGKEFKNDAVVKYFETNGTNVKFALTGRHRQLATVEKANQKIQNILFKRMASQELITGEPDKQWVDDLKPLIDVFNQHKKKPLKNAISDIPIVDEFTGNLLPIGQKVRLLLDYPINNTNHARLGGKFRTSDIKWTPDVYEITDVLIKPGFPPGYLTTKNDMVFRTKNQLSVVRNNEQEPDAKYIRGEPDTYIISEILDKKVENRKTYYLVRWKGFPRADATWEPSNIFDRTKALKEMKRDYNERDG